MLHVLAPCQCPVLPSFERGEWRSLPSLAGTKSDPITVRDGGMAYRQRFETIEYQWLVAPRLYTQRYCWTTLERSQAITERVAGDAQLAAFPENKLDRVERGAPSAAGVCSSSPITPQKESVAMIP